MISTAAPAPDVPTAKGRIIFVTYPANLARNGWWVRRFLRANKLILLTCSDLEADPVYAPHRAMFDAESELLKLREMLGVR